MANQLEVAMQQSIITLYERGWSRRRIARELKLDRATVRAYIKAWEESQAAGAKPAISTAGSGGQNQPPGTISTAGSPRLMGADPTEPGISTAGSGGQNQPPAAISTAGVCAGNEGSEAKPATAISAGAGRRSLCTSYRVFIETRAAQGLSAQRIWQDLVSACAFEGSYESVKRFVRQVEGEQELPFRRMECGPGEEAQVDFGRGAAVVGEDGRRRFAWVFRVVLSFSRKGYSEAVWKQDTETFLRALENAFRHFGGVPAKLVTDNLRAAVSRADWYDPDVHPKLRDFCRHYGTVVLPTRPRMPRHKGKVERGVGYVKDNGLKARVFHSLQEQNEHLARWEDQVADTRVHGTTRQQVRAAFEAERPYLSALPDSLFPCFHEARRIVHRDGHTEVDHAYYSAPPEYVGREVWARWDGRIVRLFNLRFEQIAVHAHAEEGRFRTCQGHIHQRRLSAVERGEDWIMKQLLLVGPHTETWAHAVIAERGIQGLRSLQGLLALTRDHRRADIEEACRQAGTVGVIRLRDLKRLLEHPRPDQPALEFLEDHPLIRPTGSYSALAPFPASQEQPAATASTRDGLTPAALPILAEPAAAGSRTSASPAPLAIRQAANTAVTEGASLP
jgi:transposase